MPPLRAVPADQGCQLFVVGTGRIQVLTVAVGGFHEDDGRAGRRLAGLQDGVLCPAEVAGEEHGGVRGRHPDAGRAEDVARARSAGHDAVAEVDVGVVLDFSEPAESALDVGSGEQWQGRVVPGVAVRRGMLGVPLGKEGGVPLGKEGGVPQHDGRQLAGGSRGEPVTFELVPDECGQVADVVGVGVRHQDGVDTGRRHGERLPVRARSSRSPWKTPASTRIRRSSWLIRYLEPVTVPAPPDEGEAGCHASSILPMNTARRPDANSGKKGAES